MVEPRNLQLPPFSGGGARLRGCMHLQTIELNAVEPLYLDVYEWARVGETV